MPNRLNMPAQIRDRVVAKIESDLASLCADCAQFKATGLLRSEKIQLLIREIRPVAGSHSMEFIISQIEQAAVRFVGRTSQPNIPPGACCANEYRTMSGGCRNCGDPSY